MKKIVKYIALVSLVTLTVACSDDKSSEKQKKCNDAFTLCNKSCVGPDTCTCPTLGEQEMTLDGPCKIGQTCSVTDKTKIIFPAIVTPGTDINCFQNCTDELNRCSAAANS